MSSAAYSDLKAAWHIDRVAQLREGKQIAPVELQFILSDLCNHSCEWCAYRAEKGLSTEQFVVYENGKRNSNPNRMIATEKALEILSDAKTLGVKSIIFTGGGEPTVHPDHMTIWSKALDMGFDCALNTNGQLLRDGWREVLPRFTYVRVSVDAGNAAEHAKTRSISEFVYPKVIANLTEIAAECRYKGSECVVGSGYVVTPENYINIYEGVKTLRDTGCAYVRLAAMQSTEGGKPFAAVRGAVREAIDRAKTLETDRFSVVDLFDSRLGRQPVSSFCGMQQYVLYIGANLRVYRCCYTAYSRIGDIGNLSDKTFSEWFYSDEKRSNIASFDARSCSICPLEDKNEAIRYAMNPKPLHVNFV